MTRRAGLTLVSALAVTAAITAATVDVLRAYLWEPLPYPASERLMLVDYPRANGPSPVALMRVDAGSVGAFAELSVASEQDSFTVLGGEAPFTTGGRWITGDVFPMFGVTPLLGRSFTREEALRGEPLALIGEQLWRDQFGGRADVIGRTITVRATLRRNAPETFTIVGVLPSRFWHLEDGATLLLPLSGARTPWLVRLREGVPTAAAAAALTALVRGQLPEIGPEWQVSMRPARDAHVDPVRPMLAATGWGVLLLATVALGNLACLQMARGVARQREVAVRIVLGAGMRDLLRDAMREALMTGALAAVAASFLMFVMLETGTAAVEQYVGRLVPGESGAFAPRLHLITAVITISAAMLLSAIALAASRAATSVNALAGTGSTTDTAARFKFAVDDRRSGAAVRRARHPQERGAGARA